MTRPPSTTHEQRPLSPHLQVYRLPLTALTSISHRITGVALWAGTFLLVGWLWAVAYDGAYFNCMRDIASHPVAKVVLIGWTLALFYHMGNGIRHLFWDAGRGFELGNARTSAYFVIMFAVAMTVAIWFALFQKISFI